MIIEIARRAEAAANELLSAVNGGGVSCDELREVLRVSRSVAAVVASVQTTAAEQIAHRERHGDGGAEVLASFAGLAQRDARDRVKVAQVVRQVPELHEAAQSGNVSQANARRLADVITKTGSDAVAADIGLLRDAQSMRPEQFVGAANRWIASQQGDNGASEHMRQRAKRYLKFYDTPEGMIALHGEFDKITGQRLHNRLRQTASRMFTADKQLPEPQRRKFPQCMADALQHHTTHTDSLSTGHRRNTSHSSGNENSRTDSRSTNTDNSISDHKDGVDTGDEVCVQTGVTNAAADAELVAPSGDVSGGWVADITVLARVDESSRDLIYELSDGSRLPPAVIEELACNARLTALVYDRCGDALWRTRSRRTVTETQWQALLATYGGCFHCGASPSMCQAHHITPYSQGGATSLDNLIMVCWNCHHRIHHDNWQIHKHPDNNHTLHPPQHADTRRYGPAHADDQQEPVPKPPPRRGQSPARTENRKTRIRSNTRDPVPATLW